VGHPSSGWDIRRRRTVPICNRIAVVGKTLQRNGKTYLERMGYQRLLWKASVKQTQRAIHDNSDGVLKTAAGAWTY
jgi:hypothetical protein